MTVLKTIGNFYIESEKIDNYVPWWVIYVGGIGFFGAMIWLFCSLYTYLGGEIPSGWHLVLTILLGISIFLFFAPAAYYTDICGAAISLNGINTSLTTKFALSNDPDRDAKKIKKVVDKYAKRAQKLDEEYKAQERSRRKQEQECCTRYSKVIEKVKPE